MQTVSGSKMPEGILPKIWTGAGALVGFLLSRYCGFALILPLGFAFAVFYLGRTMLTSDRRKVLAPVSVAIGHIGWMSAGAIYLGNWNPVEIDVFVLSVVVAWLVIAPHMIPLIVLALLQVGALLLNLKTIAAYEFGMPMHVALTAHIVVRLICLFCIHLSVLSLEAGKVTSPISSPEAAS